MNKEQFIKERVKILVSKQGYSTAQATAVANAQYNKEQQYAQEGVLKKPENEEFPIEPIDNTPIDWNQMDKITEYQGDPYNMSEQEAANFIKSYKETEGKYTNTFDSNSARDTWVNKTGLPWSEAKRLGYTDGSAKDNIKLLAELKDPQFNADNLRSAPNKSKGTPSKATGQNQQQPKQNTPNKTSKDFTYQDYQNAMKGKPQYSGNQGNISYDEDGTMVSRAGEYLANPFQTVGEYAKYGELPASGFSKNSKNAYDQVSGLINPAYWANAIGNAVDYISEGEYQKAAVEALDALPALAKLKYVTYLKNLPIDKALKLPGAKILLGEGVGTGLAKTTGSAVGKARRVIPLRNYFTPELSAGMQNQQIGQGVLGLGQGAPRLGMQQGGDFLNTLKGKRIVDYKYNSQTGNYDVDYED